MCGACCGAKRLARLFARMAELAATVRVVGLLLTVNNRLRTRGGKENPTV